MSLAPKLSNHRPDRFPSPKATPSKLQLPTTFRHLKQIRSMIQYLTSPSETSTVVQSGDLPKSLNQKQMETSNDGYSELTKNNTETAIPPEFYPTLPSQAEDVMETFETEVFKQNVTSILDSDAGDPKVTGFKDASVSFIEADSDVENSGIVANTIPSNFMTSGPPSAPANPVDKSHAQINLPQIPLHFDRPCRISALSNPDKLTTATSSIRPSHIFPPSSTPTSTYTSLPSSPSKAIPIINGSLGGSSSKSPQKPPDSVESLGKCTPDLGTTSFIEPFCQPPKQTSSVSITPLDATQPAGAVTSAVLNEGKRNTSLDFASQTNLSLGPTDITLSTSTNFPESPRSTRNPVSSSSINAFQITLTTFFSNFSHTKVRRIALLLRALLYDLRLNAAQPKATTSQIYQPYALPRYNFPAGDEPMTMEEQLDILTKCSALLSGYTKVYGAENFDERIREFDDRLCWELDNLGAMEVRTVESAVQAEPQSHVLFDKEDTATSLRSEFSDGNKHMTIEREDTESVIQDPFTVHITRHPSSSDVTMLDQSSTSLPPCNSVHPEIKRTEAVSRAPEVKPLSAIKVMSSMMRNMADLLDCAIEKDDIKGKQRAVDDTEFSLSPYEPCTLDALFTEFKLLKEELQRSKERYKEEADSMTRFCQTEVNFIKEELRAMKSDYQRESIRRCHHHDTELSIGLSQETGNDGTMDSLLYLKLIDVRRRLMALRDHARSFAPFPFQPGLTEASFAESNPALTAQQTAPHPLAHLLEIGDCSAHLSHVSPDNIAIASKSGTPSWSEKDISNAMIVDDGIPLPIKCQRKFQAFHRFP